MCVFHNSGEESGCGDGGCGSCGIADTCSYSNDEQFRGWYFVLPATGVFIVPLIFAIAAASVLRGNPSLQVAGVIGGLAAGALVGRLVTAWAVKQTGVSHG